MKRIFKQQWSIIFTNINKTNNHPSLNTKKQTTTYDVRNLAPTLEQAQHYGGVKPVNEIPTLSS